MEIRSFRLGDEISVIRLWRDCGLTVPRNDPQSDIRRKLRVQPELFLVGCDGRRIIAAVMAGYEGHRGWINYLAVHPDYRRLGIGTRLMDEAGKRLKALGCPKINLQVRSSNTEVIDFYRRIGFQTDDVVSLGKRLETDETG